MPATPREAKGLLLASIRDPNPVIFLEPKWIYRSSVEMVPLRDYEIPLGKARVVRQGKGTQPSSAVCVTSCSLACPLRHHRRGLGRPAARA